MCEMSLMMLTAMGVKKTGERWMKSYMYVLGLVKYESNV